MNRRWTNTADTATSSGMPNPTSPAIMPASTIPMPPGTGETPPSIDAMVMVKKMVGQRQVLAEGVERRAEGHGREQL